MIRNITNLHYSLPHFVYFFQDHLKVLKYTKKKELVLLDNHYSVNFQCLDK
jgi:hypothetical protein